MQTRTESDAEDDADRQVISDVQEFGWHVVAIPPEDGTPGWAFSIGMFKTLGHPEVIVFGLDHEIAHWVINEVGRRAREGTTFAAGSAAEGLLEGVTCVFDRVQPKWYQPFVGTSIWYYRGSEFPLLQCIWPDHDGKYPWDPEFRNNWVWAQPLLFHEVADEARAEALLATLE